jgi:large subunit ribosomal protein L28
MSKKCSITGRGPLSGNTRSHALNASRRKWNVNIQKTQYVSLGGKRVKIKISARGLRTSKKWKLEG